MPVGTAATVKALYFDQVKAAGADIVLANTYHLMLRPGAERVARLGGLHAFMRWDGPILTDSRRLPGHVALQDPRDERGGRALPLAHRRQPPHADARARRRDPVPARRRHPDAARRVHRAAGRAQGGGARDGAVAALGRAGTRAFAARAAPGQALFGIVQGGVDADLRRRSAEALVGMDFPGYGIGGLAVGEGQELMLATLDGVLPILPADKPRYLMGVGTPSDLIKSVARGVDMFDCVLPTRNGRHGLAFTWNGKVNLRNACHAEDSAPLDAESTCPAARDYSRAYLHHLVKSGEYLGAMLLSWVNTAFYQELMAAMRLAIEEGRFASWADATLARIDGDG